MSKLYTASEIKEHNSRKSCWIVIRNDVYDVTNYLGEHPGGEDPLLDAAGMDGTPAFEEVGHSSYAKKQMKKFKIGSLAPGEACARLRPRLWMSSGLPTSVYRCENDGKPWRNVDNSSNRSSPNRSKSASLQKCYSKSESSLKKSCSKSATSLRKAGSKSPKRNASKATISSKRSSYNIPKAPLPQDKVPIPIPRVPSIVVPRERPGARRPPPASGSRLKWALLALAVAVMAGVAYKKYAT